MLDIKYIKENPQEVIDRLAMKGKDAHEDITQIIALDSKRREIIAQTEQIKADQNRETKLVPQYKKEGKDTAPIFRKERNSRKIIYLPPSGFFE